MGCCIMDRIVCIGEKRSMDAKYDRWGCENRREGRREERVRDGNKMQRSPGLFKWWQPTSVNLIAVAINSYQRRLLPVLEPCTKPWLDIDLCGKC